MRWFKHDADANQDAKLKRIRMKYGLEGYGLYWYCLELIAANVEANNLTFELEHDAEIIAFDTGIHYERVQEMMTFMVKLGLFEEDQGVVTCLKLAKRLDQSMTSNPRMRQLIQMLHSGNHDDVNEKSDDVMQDKIRLDKNRSLKTMSGKPVDNSGEPDKNPAHEVIDYLNERARKHFKPTAGNCKFINARLKEGFTVEDCRLVIQRQAALWLKDRKMNEFLRPSTLFNSEKFQGYLNARRQSGPDYDAGPDNTGSLEEFT